MGHSEEYHNLNRPPTVAYAVVQEGAQPKARGYWKDATGRFSCPNCDQEVRPVRTDMDATTALLGSIALAERREPQTSDEPVTAKAGRDALPSQQSAFVTALAKGSPD